MTTPIADPSWQAARNGLPGDATASNRAAQIAQFLATHGITPVYSGVQIITPGGNVGYGDGGIDWINLGVSDIDQPFTQPAGKTTIGRVTLPLSPVRNGADVVVSLCADSGGSPGTVLASTVLPAAVLGQLAPAGAGPLATAQSGTLRMGEMTTVTWASPVSGAASVFAPSVTQSGNFLLEAGGQASNFVANVYTVGWAGGAAPGTVLPQPSLPVATADGVLIATTDTLVYAGGALSGTGVTPISTVWSAGWSPAAGTVQAWTSQPSLVQAVTGASGAYDPATDTVYVIGGDTSTGSVLTTDVQYSQIVNGQLAAWKTGHPLPVAREYMITGVVSGWLIAIGGADSSGLFYADTWLSQLADGVPGPWIPGPPLAMTVTGQFGCAYTVTSAGIVIAGGIGTGSPTNQLQTLTVTADGPGTWQAQTLDPTVGGGGPWSGNPVAAFPLTSGEWELFVLSPFGGQYSSGILSAVPAISVPLPATGLTPGSTYHLLLHQDNGDPADYVQAALDPGALAAAAKTRPNGGGSWTGLPNTYSLFAGIFDETPGGPILHLWQDSGARVVTFTWASVTGQLLGAAESTAFPLPALNSNPYFAGSTGWTGFNGTFTVTSSPPAGAPAAVAGKYVNNGVTAGAMEESGQQFTVTPSAQYGLTAWVWSSTGNVRLGFDWTLSGTFVSTSAVTVTVPASTWTEVTIANQTAPSSGVNEGYARVGTPNPDGGTTYAWGVVVTAPGAAAAQLAAVTEITYNSAGLPSGTVQLA